MRYFVEISFCGIKYNGWQIQKNGQSVEEEVEKALSIQLNEQIDVVGAGRTDTGVNATYFIAHFDSENKNLIKDRTTLLYKINAILPYDICVKGIYPVKEDAHARFDATSRTYKYYITLEKDPFGTNFSYHFKHRIDIEEMNRATQFLIGTKDFSCFEKSHGGNTTSICTVTNAIWEKYSPDHLYRESDNYYVFTITANRFLRNMVRAIVGSLLEIGRGKHNSEWIIELLERQDRCRAGQSVPGNGLFLTDIQYPYMFNN